VGIDRSSDTGRGDAVGLGAAEDALLVGHVEFAERRHVVHPALRDHM